VAAPAATPVVTASTAAPITASAQASPRPLPSAPPSFGGPPPTTTSYTSNPPATNAARAVSPSGPSNVVTVTGPLVQPEGLLAPSVIERVRAVAGRLREERATWGSLVEHAVIIRCDADGFELAYEKRSFFAAQLADGTVAEAITRAAHAELGAPTRILVCDGKLSGRTIAQISNEQRTAALDAARREAVSHPVVQDAINIFKAEVKNVKLPGED
jgi:hypothetical protein